MQFQTANEVCGSIKVSMSTLNRWTDPMSRYYDPSFPKPIKFGARKRRWESGELERWINGKKNNSRKTKDAAVKTIPLNNLDSDATEEEES